MIVNTEFQKLTQASLAEYIALRPKNTPFTALQLDEMNCQCRTGKTCVKRGCQDFPHRHRLVKKIKRYRKTHQAKLEKRSGYKKLIFKQTTCALLADEWLWLRYKIPTFKTVMQRRKSLIKRATEKGHKPLPRCHEQRPCKLWACPVCRRLHQLQLLAALKLSGNDIKDWIAVTIIPEYGQSELGKQPLGGLRKFAKRLKDTLEETAPGLKTIFVIETSIERNLERELSCQWHVHGLMSPSSDREYEAIKKGFAWKNNACHAVHQSQTKTAYDVVQWLAYSSKPQIKVRTRYLTEGIENVRKSRANLTQETRVKDALKTRRVHRRLIAVGMDEFEAVLA